MTVRVIQIFAAAMIGFAVGVCIVLALLPNEQPDKLVCRPSAPELLRSESVVLFLGNSLAFDTDWPLDTFQTVNCARQGLTVAAALPLVDTLPNISPKAVVLVFGTVELIRGVADPDAFRANMTAMVEALRRTFPEVPIVALGVASVGEDWVYKPAVAGALNSAMRNVDDIVFIPLDPILAQHNGPVNYDGVHLTPTVYPAIREALNKHFAGGFR